MAPDCSTTKYNCYLAITRTKDLSFSSSSQVKVRIKEQWERGSWLVDFSNLIYYRMSSKTSNDKLISIEFNRIENGLSVVCGAWWQWSASSIIQHKILVKTIKINLLSSKDCVKSVRPTPLLVWLVNYIDGLGQTIGQLINATISY